MPIATPKTAAPARKRQPSNAVVKPSPINEDTQNETVASAASGHRSRLRLAASTCSIVSPGLNHTDNHGEVFGTALEATVMATPSRHRGRRKRVDVRHHVDHRGPVSGKRL